MITTNSTSITLGNLNIEIFDLHKIVLQSGLTPIAHQHSFYEIHFILNGWVVMNLNGKICKVEKDYFFILPKNFTHCCKEQSEDFENFTFVFDLTYKDSPPEKMTMEYGYFNELFSSEDIKTIKITSYEKNIINNIYNNLNNFSIYGFHKTKTEVTNLLLEVSKQLCDINKNVRKNKAYLPSDDRNILRKYKIEVFVNNQESDKSLKALADTLGLSPRQASRFVKESYGQTFKELWTSTRMIMAKNMIQENKMSLEKIAYTVGYSSYNGFLQAYVKYFGHSPSETEKVET